MACADQRNLGKLLFLRFWGLAEDDLVVTPLLVQTYSLARPESRAGLTL